MINSNLDFRFYHPEKDIYTDGDIENEILEAVQNNNGLELLASDCRWPVLYHLSPERENLLTWYPFKKESKLLEIGCGCGALTGLFTHRVKNVEAVESSKRRATITAIRHKNTNLLIHVGEFTEIASQLNGRYDYVTLIGVLEYSPVFVLNSQNPFVEMLRKCCKLLCSGGKLFLAIENRLGIKYFAGAREDHIGQRFTGLEGYQKECTVKTFSHRELLNLLMQAGFKQNNLEWYYPYPDYKFATQVFSDHRLPYNGDLYADIESLDRERIELFDERKFLQSISPNDFPMFSNSFLVIARKED